MIKYKIYKDITLIASGVARAVKCKTTIGVSIFQLDHVPLVGILNDRRQNVVIYHEDDSKEEIEIQKGIIYFENNELILMTEGFIDVYEGQ